jgi:hypothetical protein
LLQRVHASFGRSQQWHGRHSAGVLLLCPRCHIDSVNGSVPEANYHHVQTQRNNGTAKPCMPILLPFAVAWNEISAIHEQHIAVMAEKWQACLAVEQELSSLELEHGTALSELRGKWDASLDELEASAAAQLKNLETKLLAKRKKGNRKKKDPAVMQQLLDALL